MRHETLSVFRPLWTALTGKAFTPGGAIEVLNIPGREESLRQIAIGIGKIKKLSRANRDVRFYSK